MSAKSYKTRSQASCSSTGSAAAKARARAEAAKTRLTYAQKEVSLKMEKAQLEASIELLQCEKEAATATEEAEVLEAAVQSQMDEQSNGHVLDDLPSLESSHRTERYVMAQSKFVKKEITEIQEPPSADKPPANTVDPPCVTHLSHTDPADCGPPPETKTRSKQPAYDHHLPAPPLLLPHPPLDNRDRNHNWTQQKPRDSYHDPTSDSRPSGHNDGNISEFVRYFARREIVATGLLQFNDKPQNYRAWKRSFENTVRGLDLTASEEMDLLFKWLGKESAEHVEQIRAIHINRPDAGLKMTWERLDQCYGSAEVVEDALFKRIDNFPKITNRDYVKLRKFSDILMELQSAKEEGDLPGLSFLDSARGLNPIVQKLPFYLQEKWVSVGASYKREYQVSFPPFHVFVDFVSQEATVKNDPSFNFATHLDSAPRPEKPPWKFNRQREVSVHKTQVFPNHSYESYGDSKRTDDCDRLCPVHKKPHALLKCRVFCEKSIEERKTFLKENNICFRCCASSTHFAKHCKAKVQCSECGKENHNTALHPGPAPWSKGTDPDVEHGGEQGATLPSEITSKCTQVCGENLAGRSCSKICLVKVYPASHPDKAIRLYAIHDEQSNRSLVRSEFFEVFGENGPSSPYALRTCAGLKETMGRRATGYVVETLEGTVHIPLPSLIECNDIPDNREEIPTPSAALHHPHLKNISHLIPELDPNAQILMLLGRDIIRVHKVHKQISGPNNAPYAQKLDLGWVIVGNVCLVVVHKTITVNAFYTNTTERGRPTLFQPCPNLFNIKERSCGIQIPYHNTPQLSDRSNCESDHLGFCVFEQTKNDNQVSPSIQDNAFMKIMEEGMTRDANNHWTAPLPFKSPRQRLPNNRPQTMNRLMSLIRNFDRKPELRDHFITFMAKIFRNGHAEIAPPLKENEERWYLPLFGVYHPKKPKQIRVVFDSSAQYNGLSLNDVLLKGPDLNNTLLGVLMRFRKEAVAFTADIEQMFYCFYVREEDRNFLRFLWFRDNNLCNDIIEYRMRVHVFGNSPSPAVAIFGLHQSVQCCEVDFDADVKQFVTRDFYVDDGLKSLPTVEMAVTLLRKTRDILAKSNLRLHKIAANRKEILEAFPSQEHAKDLKDLDLEADALPMQRSLGLLWDLKKDCFTFNVSDETKPFTRRGVLSTINSLYDPLGFVAPVTIHGKSILRELTADSRDWDAPLPQGMEESCVLWRESLGALSSLSITRTYTNISPSEATYRELCIFCDASTKAIAAVAYVKVTDAEGNQEIGFIMGKAKLTPRPEQTIPRLELCAAVLAVEIADLVSGELDIQLNNTHFFTDSKVVLGYICNETRRFYVYVSNRVARIRRSSQANQWHYVPTDQNPADLATRSVPAHQLMLTNWFTGPKFLLKDNQSFVQDTFDLVEPSSDTDIRPQVSILKTTAGFKLLGSKRLTRFSQWSSLLRAIARLLHVVHAFKQTTNRDSSCKGWHYCGVGVTVEEFEQAKNIVIRIVQEEVYAGEIKCINEQQEIP